jgi:hypothetical protein
MEREGEQMDKEGEKIDREEEQIEIKGTKLREWYRKIEKRKKRWGEIERDDRDR